MRLPLEFVGTSIANRSIKTVTTTKKEREHFCLNDNQILELAQMVLNIEKHYSKLKGSWCPMDIEWAVDGVENKLYIIQARPETIHTKANVTSLTLYKLKKQRSTLKTLLIGQSIGQQIVTGLVRVIKSATDIDQIKDKEKIIIEPEWTAPELILVKNQLSKESDIFSFAFILYSLW